MNPPPLGNPTTESEAEFWTRQLCEHSLFLHLMIEDADLAKRAKALELAFENVRKLLPGKTAPEQANSLTFPVHELRALKTEILDRQLRGEWLGWAWPRFIEHVRAELDYAWSRIVGMPQDPQTELCTWLGFMADHAAFAAQLLDPTEAEKIRQALMIENHLADAGCQCVPEPIAPPDVPVSGCQASTLATLLTLSKQRGQELDAYFKNLGVGTSKVRSIIHPVLAIHVVREGQRFLGTIERLKSA